MTTGAPVVAERSINKQQVGVLMLEVHKKRSRLQELQFLLCIWRGTGSVSACSASVRAAVTSQVREAR